MLPVPEVALLRLAAQWVAGPGGASPVDVVRRLGAVQGQDFPGAVTSIALRTADRRRSDVEMALDDGEIVRSWPMRGTLHVLAADDLHWMLALLSTRAMAGLAGRRERLLLTEADVERAREIVLGALDGGRRMRRADLLAAIEDGGVATTGQRGYHLLWYLAQTGTLCLGPTDGAGEQLFVLLDDWVRTPRRLAGEEALGELARRFFLGHGPATVQDLARWAGIPLRDVRAGLAVARPELEALDVDGVEHLMDPATPDRLAGCRKAAGGLFLLPGFDEFVLGYGDRRAILDPEFADRIVPGNNGMFRSTVVHGGRIVGTWQWTGRGAKRTVTATPFTSFPEALTAEIRDRAARLP
ncbi:winged helix DNA-binding domain-containing protein [Blastococcus sp. CT_GayMR16]|uniref:winged helix DNA-binding domain-containing protein n=1 Tax=Blastococcus sp. CT_GayMR16 TaxID=2559607 RepID=UPI001073C9F6|nr:winged helix DNA-binding domain-containing protein [Blastococcus sp. CT_GayMR16]TFV86013.1 winged helix DNA-binding domain-containing protein [Blastococcus sp. CT_GayMR16]